MRPANLIPPEERRSGASSLRSAPVAYIVVGALLLAIGALTLLVTTNGQISDSKAEVAEAKRQIKTAKARATELATYTEFHATAATRTETITNLANSRFDWEKVMRQMALIAPPGVWLTSLTGAARSGVSLGSSESSALSSGITGPSLNLSGCAVSQGAVANYITELKEIEGVTRVGLQGTGSVAAEGGSSSTAASAICVGERTKEFQVVAAFDAAPIPEAIIGGEETFEAPIEEAPAEGESGTTETTEGE